MQHVKLRVSVIVGQTDILHGHIGNTCVSTYFLNETVSFYAHSPKFKTENKSLLIRHYNNYGEGPTLCSCPYNMAVLSFLTNQG